MSIETDSLSRDGWVVKWVAGNHPGERDFLMNKSRVANEGDSYESIVIVTAKGYTQMVRKKKP